MLSAYSTAESQKDFNYKDIRLKNTKYYDQIALKAVKNISKVLFLQGFKPLSSGILPEAYFADQVYSKSNGEFMFRLGVKFPDKHNNKMIRINDGVAYHFVDTIPVALFSRNISEKRFQALINIFKSEFKKVSKKREYSFLDKLNPLPSAQAQRVGCYDPNLVVPSINLTDYEKVNKHVTTSATLAFASDCFMDAIKQAWSATGGMIKDTAKGIWNFIKSPVKSAKSAWQGAVNMVKVTKDFVMNMEQNISKLGDAFASLSPEMISKIMCMLVGTLGGEQLLKMLINPAVGIALLIPKVVKMFKKLGSSGAILKTLEKASAGFEDSSKMTSQFLSNFLSNTSSKFSNTLSLLAKYDMGDRLMEYGVCAVD